MLLMANVTQGVCDAGVSATIGPLEDKKAETVRLNRNETRQLKGSNRLQLITCDEGLIWVTQQHDPTDYMLGKGDIFLVTLPGSVVIQALKDARLTIARLSRPTVRDGQALHFA